jgi:alpha-L-rhamnosidase
VAGIEIDENKPGYKHIIFQPQPGGGLKYADAHVNSMYGRVDCGWEIKDDQIAVRVTVPPNTWATVHLPDASLSNVREGKNPLRGTKIRHIEQLDHEVKFDIGSGHYTFTYPYGEGKPKE